MKDKIANKPKVSTNKAKSGTEAKKPVEKKAVKKAASNGTSSNLPPSTGKSIKKKVLKKP